MHNDYNATAQVADVRLLSEDEIQAVSGGLSTVDTLLAWTITLGSLAVIGKTIWDWFF
jgi:hypothetical protein